MIRAGLKEKVLAGFVLGLIAIGLIGYQVHNQMTDLASSLYNNNRPHNKIVQYQKILATLSNAESNVRTFSITNNEFDLKQFENSREKLLSHLSKIEVSSEDEEIRTLNNLIHSKINIMDGIILLRRKNPSENLLEEALTRIEDIKDRNISPQTRKKSTQPLPDDLENEDHINNDKTQIALHEDVIEEENINQVEEETEEVEEKKNFFQRLFSRKKSKEEKENEQKNDDNQPRDKPIEKEYIADSQETNTTEIHIDDTSNNNSGANDNITIEETQEEIKSSIKQLQQENKLKTSVWQDDMISLIEADNRIMQQIREKMAKLEQREVQNQDLFISAAARSRDSIINNTTVVGVGAFTIILFLSLIIVQDFDKLRKNRLTLISEKEKANKHAKVKEEFLANMSHEIRTPMNAIVGYSELLEKTNMNQEQKEFLKTIQLSSNHLMVILNDILDFSKLESGKLTINNEPFNPAKCVNQVMKSMDADARKKGIELRKNIDPGMLKNLIGDSIRFQQILFNLLSNAIKFTDKGYVEINLSGEMKGQEQLVTLTVKDTGTGIKKEYADRIFEDFEQVETGRNRKYGGTGLGLAIVKRLIKLQNGSICLESEVGKGSTFRVQIPYKVSKIKNEKKKVKPSANKKIKFDDLKILVVDDQEYNLELIKIILDKWGADVELASSAKEALDQINQEEYNLVLMDVQMPEMTGIEATKIIRKKNGGTPIVALTAASTKEETDRCISAGMDDFLLKPFKQNELYEIIKKYASTGKDDSKVANSGNLFKNLYQLANGKNSFIIDMLEVFHKNITADLQELKKNSESHSFVAAQRTAHKMIPPSRHLGFDELAEKLEKIEKNTNGTENIEELKCLTQEAEKLVQEALVLVKSEIRKLREQ